MSLIAWYKLDGNINDSSDSHNDLVTATATYTSSGKINGAYTFASGNTIYKTSGFNFYYDLTVCAWGYGTSIGGNMLFSLNSTSWSGADLYFTGGTICWNTGDGGGNPFKNNGVNVVYPSTNTWHHYTVVISSSLNKTILYLDGTYYGEANYKSPYQVNRGFTIGNYYPGSTGYAWIGKIDDVRIYDEVLSEKEIKELSKAKVLHYDFDDMQEPTTNLVPNSPINSYPSVGNEHGTYNTNQYNNNVYFSIGTIDNITDNIVTLSVVDHAIYTYDVLRPQTTGGGVTAGTDYFIKKLSSNSFTLHAYNSSQDGSLGFAVYDSIKNDQRISISLSSFPTMWIGAAHRPNSALVKEILPNGFYYDGRFHDCIRCHGEHKPEGSQDYMAYSVYPPVIAGETYTFSFMARAANSSSIGKNINFSAYTGAGWTLTGDSLTFSDLEWHKVTKTGVAPNTGGTNMYFPFSKGGTIDISEIMVEHKDHASLYTETSRTGFIKDCSGYENNSYDLDEVTSPQWLGNSKIGKGNYYFNGSSSFLEFIQPLNSGSNFTISLWYYPTRINSSYDMLFTSTTDNIDLQLFFHATSKALTTSIENVEKTTSFVLNSGNINQWYHIVWTYDYQNTKVYVNGISVLNTPQTTAFTIDNTSIRIGKLNTSYFLQGNIDDVTIYATALSESDILELYQTRAQIDNLGNFNGINFIEPENLAYLVSKAIDDKVFANGLSSYTQSNCQVTLTDDGYRIYRPPNLIYPTAGTTMWGGFLVNLAENEKQIGHTYKVTLKVKGQSSNSSEQYFAYSVGWSSMGINLSGGGSLSTTIIPSNFQSNDYVIKEATYTVGSNRFMNGTWPCDITSGSATVYYNASLSGSASRVTAGSILLNNSYFPNGTIVVASYTDRFTTSMAAINSGTNVSLQTNTIYDIYRQLKIGFTYTSTGTLGTDLYIKDFNIIDITNEDINGLVDYTGIITKENFSEVGIADDIVGWWPLNGDALDVSGNRNDGTVSGATIASGLNGLCYYFDGTNDVINLPSDVGYTTKFTASAWFKSLGTPLNGYHIILGGQYLEISIPTAGALRIGTYCDTTRYVNNFGSGLTDGNWHFVTSVFNGTELSGYIDGIYVGQITGITGTLVYNYPKKIGQFNGDNDYVTNGLIEDVRIYNRALSSEEIKILYDLGNSNIKAKNANNTLYVKNEFKELL